MPIWLLPVIREVLVPLAKYAFEHLKKAPTEHMNEVELEKHNGNIKCLGTVCEHLDKLQH